MDFQPMRNQPAGLERCTACGAVFMADETTKDEIRQIYAGTDYAREKKTEHRVHDAEAEEAQATTYRAIADFLAGKYRSDSPKVLDVGCFDGKLLLELEADCTSPEMHGFDVSPAIAERFPAKQNYRYWCPDLSEVGGTFDLICIVNTLMYIEDAAAFMDDIDRLLGDDGLLFLVTPNTAINPCFLTLGDQMLYFSPANLSNLMGRYGFSTTSTTDHPAFPRSILATCWRASTPAAHAGKADPSFAEASMWLTSRAQQVRTAVGAARRQSDTGRICVLGGAHNAAWAYNAANGDIDCFVDENPARAGTEFYGKPIVHPRETNAADIILLPYGETAGAIVRKFEKMYAAQLVEI